MTQSFLEQGDLLTLDNQKEYMVVSQTILEGKYYIYLVSNEKIPEPMICSLEGSTLTQVQGPLFMQLLDLFKNKLAGDTNGR